MHPPGVHSVRPPKVHILEMVARDYGTPHRRSNTRHSRFLKIVAITNLFQLHGITSRAFNFVNLPTQKAADSLL